MKNFPTRLMCLMLAACTLPAAHAAGPYSNPDDKLQREPVETYPVPYKLPVAAEITAQLDLVRGFIDRATPTRIVDRNSGQLLVDLSTPSATAVVEPSPHNFNILQYETGVMHAGLMLGRRVTGDPRWTATTERHLAFIHQHLPYFRAQEQAYQLGRANSFTRFLAPHALDDAGSMCAAMMRARSAGLGPDLAPQIAVCGDWVAKRQVRLKDGTLARNRPQAWSVWADDMYMGVPALAELARMTGKRHHFDDAVANVLGMSHYLFNDRIGLYTHGWNQNNPDAPQFYWGRANGWAVLAMSDLLDILPSTHPGYKKVLAQHRRALRGIAQQQSGSGLWHQMLDRHDSFLETSASALFVYAIAHAINQGWISPTTYGSIAQAGWAGLSATIRDDGAIEGGVAGTTFASDHVYYYNRPTSINAPLGYGPILLAGFEIIKLMDNPAFTITDRVKTYHYKPK